LEGQCEPKNGCEREMKRSPTQNAV
jgi:hypothetical protein